MKMWPPSATNISASECQLHQHAFEQAADYNGAVAEDPAVDGIRLLPGARAATASLPTDRWAVATSAARAIAERCLSGVDLRPGALVAIEDVARGKPAPDPYIAAAMRLGADPADCLVIEDAPPGITAGRAAGCDVIGLTTTHAPSNLMAASALLADLRDLRITLADDHRTLWIGWPDP